MSGKDLNHIAKIEKAIKDKYGEEAIQNPKGSWDEEKEKKYLKELKSFYKTKKINTQIKEEKGFKIKTRRPKKNNQRICPICKKYSFEGNDDLYMTKFECCFDCYIQYIEGREERWKTGWRPNS